MPSALAMTRSSGVVMKPRTRSAFAPTYTVDTRTTAISLSVRILQVVDDEDRVAVGRIADRGGRQRNDRAARTQNDLGLDEHSRAQFAAGVRERRLHLNVSRPFVDNRVDRRDAPSGHDPGSIIRGDTHGAADS